MAALSTETTVTTTWASIVADGSDYVIQNNGLTDVYLFFKATAPATTSDLPRLCP